MGLTAWTDSLLQRAGWDAPHWTDLLIASLVGSVIMFTVVLSTGGLFTFAFRRIFARMGQRPGPNRVGPGGILQFLADGAKLITKEDVRPAKVDRLAWTAALYVAVVFTVLAWAPLPWGEGVWFANVGTGILLLLAMGAIAPLAEIMAGWGSNNKYSLYGGVRAAALDVSYEIPMLFAVAAVILLVGSLSTNDIVLSQAGVWFIVPQIVGFVIFFITALAKAGLVPTDLAESESELVAGYTTEYSGMRFGMFFVVIFSNVFFVGALATMLYLGGWQAPLGQTFPILASFLGPATGVFWFAVKSLLMSFVVFWVWSTLPRVRVDQYLNMAWRVLLPISILNFVGTAVVVRLFQTGVL
ncbi:MAG TPA: complex I subunit 1 family protein [Candidatus Thermoplasmatota archaeon]|nr:complex I subunit 1 family protein [Candidatus Thermoplasmatota archaeon]